ncbi:MAG: RIP metalloprotease RseP [Candidatus Lambdaproteobacteria bacterium]|nr:RIP metalloprotease RseP [Candidatus Lambdaproteobacteria bacterium]
MIVTILLFIAVLGFLVFVHEGGHFLAARQVGIRVLQFSIGFPPRLFGRRVGETEYVVSWIPLGGYVRLEGQNIEDENPDDPRNWAAKSILARLYVLVAGPAFNLILAFLLMPVVYMIGVEMPGYRNAPAVLADVALDSPAQQAGFRAGDRIVGLNGQQTPTWNDLYERLGTEVIAQRDLRITVARGDATLEFSAAGQAFADNEPFGWKPRIDPTVGQFSTVSPAREAGLRTGDVIVAIDGHPIQTWDQIPATIQAAGGSTLNITVRRGDEQIDVHVTPHLDEPSERWLVGISPHTVLERHGPLEAVRLGSERLVQITAGTFVFLGRLLSGNGSLDGLGGPVKIGAVIGEAARTSAPSLVFLIAVISLQLGIFNLLPIPALDGGHIFMLAIEKIKGHPLSARVRERTQIVGFSLLMLLILIVTYNDIIHLIT